MIETSLYHTALRFEGMREIPGQEHNPWIQWAFSLTTFPKPWTDEDAWCSAAMQGWCYTCGLYRTGSAAAASWLEIGPRIKEIRFDELTIGEDILVFDHHVTIYAGPYDDLHVKGLGGNQSNKVGVDPFLISKIKGCRRLS